ncbi:hypothetical protein CKO15_09870 [Halorhodospira abdelmalekii]|nr:hypothetical protein [Halorhodospira abdelmalekii]
MVAAFSDRAAAVEFAGAWGFYCGCNIAMRQHVTGGQSLWAVSVPVFWPRAGQGVAPSRANDRITWVARH